MTKPNLSTGQWITIIIALVSGCAGITVFAYNNFDQKGSAENVEKDVVVLKKEVGERMNRFEDKIDRIEELQIATMMDNGTKIPPRRPSHAPHP